MKQAALGGHTIGPYAAAAAPAAGHRPPARMGARVAGPGQDSLFGIS